MRYCEGLPEHAERALDPFERARTLAARRRAGWWAVAALAAIPAVVASVLPVAWLVLEVLRLPEAWSGPAIGLYGIAVLLGGLPVALVTALDRIRAWAALRRDLVAGTAVEFGEGARQLLVLPGSGRILARGGRPDDLRRRAAVGEAAPVPEGANTWSIPYGDVPERLRSAGWVKRALDPAERGELEAFAARGERFPWMLAVLTVAFLAALVARWRPASEGGTGPAGTAAVLVLVGLGWWRVASARAMARRMRADAREGWVLRATQGPAAGDEMLPGSRAAWALRGTPARWRLRRRR